MNSIDTSIQSFMESSSFSLSDADAVGLILHGGSVIDWMRLNFSSVEEVDSFLALHGFDNSDQIDRRRLFGLFLDAVEYITENFDYPLPAEISAIDDVRSVFLLASGKNGEGSLQVLSCMILKLMHIIHHAQARELLFLSPIADRQIFVTVERKVGAEVVEMQKSGFPICRFSGTRKTLHNQVTRLLADRGAIAARVFDKVLFQIVTEKKDDIVPVLRRLSKKVFPFNYVVPGTTSNTLIDFKDYINSSERIHAGKDLLQFTAASKFYKSTTGTARTNSVNFIVDMPLKLDELGVAVGSETQERLGRIVFSLVEFQIQDLGSVEEQEAGETSMSNQRKKIKKAAWERLTGGKLS